MRWRSIAVGLPLFLFSASAMSEEDLRYERAANDGACKVFIIGSPSNNKESAVSRSWNGRSFGGYIQGNGVATTVLLNLQQFNSHNQLRTNS